MLLLLHKGYNQSKMDETGKTNSQRGSVINPFVVGMSTWDEHFRQLEENIRDAAPFEGKWESYISNNTIVIPKELRHIFDTGGVITFGLGRHLLLFGHRHWAYIQKLLSKEAGNSPVNNPIARQIYGHMHRFNKLNDDGAIVVPTDMAAYAGLKGSVAIIGMIYHAELYDKNTYLISEDSDQTDDKLAQLRSMKLN